MKITWLGHASFRIEIGGQVLLVDPWLEGNPVFPADRYDDAVAGATHILLTHGHGDHASNALAIAKAGKIPILCIHEIAEFWSASEGVDCVGFGKGGTVTLGDVKVTMVNATHSSSLDFTGGAPMHAGSEAGFMIAGEGHVIYVSGDTDIMADMEWMGDYHEPDIGILCCGGHYTMDMDRAAYAAKKYFDFKMIIPCHYKTFPILAQSAQPLVDALPDIDVLTPAVMEVIEI
ncbi:MAG: metal-dependent hydrolase [Pseudomonadota bacterium]